MAKVTDLWVNIGAKTDKLDQGLKTAEGKLKGFNTVINKIGFAIAGAFAVSKLTAFTGQAIKMAGELEGVKYAFDALNKPGLLSELQKATKGTVSDLELMKSAVQASNFKVPLEQLGSLLKFAHLRAQQTGQSVDYLVQSIVLGIGRKSPLILDNLGISAIALREKFKGLEVEMAGVGDIAKAVGEIATEEMKKSGEAIDTTKTSIENMNAQWQNTKTIIGEIVAPAVKVLNELLAKTAIGWKNILKPEAFTQEIVSDEINRITKSLSGLSREDAIKTLTKEMAVFRTLSAELSSKKFFIFGKGLKEAEQTLSAYSQISFWLSEIAYNYDALGKLITPPVLTPPKGGGGFKAPKNTLQPLSPLPGADSFPNKAMDEYLQKGLQVVDVNEKMTSTMEKMTIAAETMAGSIVDAFGNVENIKDFANAIKETAKQVILSIIAQTMAENMAKAARGSKTWWGAIIQGAAAAAATSAMFNVIPSFAQGGVVNGKQLAMVGDNPSGKEAIIPSELWNKIGGQRVQIEGVIKGRDIYWSNKNYTDFLNRTT